MKGGQQSMIMHGFGRFGYSIVKDCIHWDGVYNGICPHRTSYRTVHIVL